MNKNLKLIKFKKTDISKKYLNWVNNKKLTKYTSIKKKYSLDDLRLYVKNCLKDKGIFFFKIIFNNKHIGNLRVQKMFRNSCTIGILIGVNKIHNKGIGTYCINLAVNFIKKKKISKIYIFLNKENKSSIKIFTKNNFKFIKKIPKKIILKKDELLLLKKLYFKTS